MKRTLLLLFLTVSQITFAQYIAVKAKYTETRLINDDPNPPKREDHLILSFYEVSSTGVYTVANLSNFDLWIYKEGLQYGNNNGGVLDSTGNNYPGYSYTAPKAVAYYNSLGLNYIDCDPNLATHYIVNGSALDVGFINVSYWDIDYGTGNPIECFTAPNICLPYYPVGHPYYYAPGNLNFDWTAGIPGPPYNLYNFNCGGPQQTVMRGVLAGDTGYVVSVLPVKFSALRGELDSDKATISFSNLTESGLLQYDIEKSVTGDDWQRIGTILPLRNDGSVADYRFATLQPEDKAFYRVKAVEIAGHIYYSTIIVLNKPVFQVEDPEPVLSVFPNPVNGSAFTLRLSNADTGRYLFCIVTPDGRQVKQKMIEHNLGGNLTRQIELSDLPAGTYRAVLRTDKKKFIQTFIYAY